MNHKQKVKLARRLLDQDKSVWLVDGKGERHRRKGYGLFNNESWNKRKMMIKYAVRNKEIGIQYAKQSS